jgi:hypothetical protein
MELQLRDYDVRSRAAGAPATLTAVRAPRRIACSTARVANASTMR